MNRISNAISVISFFVSILSAYFTHSQLNSSRLETVYQRMDSYFSAYDSVVRDGRNPFSLNQYESSQEKTKIALTAERLLLVLDALNRAGETDMANKWLEFLKTMIGPLCDRNIRLDGFTIEEKTRIQLQEAHPSDCSYNKSY